MGININLDAINDLDTAISVIRKLQRGMNECYSATFNVCPRCGEIKTDGYICWNCRYGQGEDENQKETTTMAQELQEFLSELYRTDFIDEVLADPNYSEFDDISD